MKHKMISVVLGLLACGALRAADTAPTNQVADAIAKLKAASNYSWTVTTAIPDSPWTPTPAKGQADKDGFATVSQVFNDNTIQVALKGDKVAVKGEDGWQLVGGEGAGPETFFAASLARNGAAAEEAAIILKALKDLKAVEGNALGGDLTSDGATDLMAFGPRRAGTNNANGFPPPKNVKGSAKFWLKDGALTKFELHLHGTMSFGDNENEMDITRTVEIQNVGTTKMDIPAEAKKKLEAKPEAAPAAK